MPESQAALGFTRTPSEDDPRRDPLLLGALERIAPGTELRQAIDDVIRSHEGALIVIGDPNELAFLFSGGMRLEQPFTPHRGDGFGRRQDSTSRPPTACVRCRRPTRSSFPGRQP